MKIVVSDIHGTLLNKKNELIKPVASLLESLKKDGYMVVLFSGHNYIEGGSNELKATLQKLGFSYNHILLLDNPTYNELTNNEPEAKMRMLNDYIKTLTIEKVSFIIDNEKSCIKEYQKNGYNTFQFRQKD